MDINTATLDIDVNDITDKVLALRELWISRSKDYPFYTLGRCAYLDGKLDSYYKDSAWQNDILLGEFDEVYEKVLDTLEKELKESVYIAHDLAIPGFHIFPSDPKFTSIAGSWHQDYPHHTLNIGDKDASAFTVAIKLPVSGGGMDYIDEFHQQHYFPYRERDLILHDGLTIHRIAGLKKFVPGEYRITLQGHIVRRNNLLEVFF